MTTSDIRWTELSERIAQTERRTQALELLLLHDTRQPTRYDSHAEVDTPRPQGTLKRNILRSEGTSEGIGLSILEAIGPRSGSEFLEAIVEQLAKAFDARAAVIAIPHPEDVQEARTVAAWIDGRLMEPHLFSAQDRFVRVVLAGGAQIVPASARDRYPDDEFLQQLRAESALAAPLIDAAGRILGFVAVVDDRAMPGSAAERARVVRALAPRIAVELQRPDPPPAAEGDDLLVRLLAGTAHDFNNLLTVVTGHAELLREHIPAESHLRESVEAIVSSGYTAARIARQLVEYSKPSGDSDPQALDPNAAIRDAERVLVRLVGARIELDLVLASGVAPIRVDRTEFDRVVLNLVANARDAIEDAGVVSVRTAMAQVAANRRGWPADCPPGEYVAVTVADTGCGMTDEVKARAFTRFFTTKGAKGTGLGLATVRDIVTAAGGHVEIESSIEWGTSVRVFWPSAKDSFE